jgi:exodeoxyribonuclease V beta subunit
MSAPREFDIAGPLPEGVTILEASAGTGKTYAIATLAARYVADGIPLQRLLLVTFTRMATGELRERVRERLGEVQRGLAEALAGSSRTTDPVIALLARGSPVLVAQRQARLHRALADFDSATIATTHSFCQEVLGGLGIAADLEPEALFVEDVSDLVAEVIDDVYLRMRVFHRDDRPLFSRSEAMAIARAAIENPTTEIVPATGDLPKLRVRLAVEARRELDARKRRLALMTYDDLLTRLQEALSGPSGEAVAQRLRERYAVVLIDEFQDTDPVQWEIVRRAFGDGTTTLVLIADPKQAIYAFRGADVYAYLQAAEAATQRATLAVNRRSDQPLIDAFDALFHNAKLGHPGIAYREVHATEAAQASRLRGTPNDAPLRIRIVDRTRVGTTARGFAITGAARAHIARDLAADLVGLFASGAEVPAGRDGAPEPVAPGHVAVLVGTNRNAALVRQALQDAGVPSVINGAGSVFATDSARDWLRLLEALERPGGLTRAHAVALTPFIDWPAQRVALAGDEEWELVHRRLHEWARVLRERGVASLLEVIGSERALPELMLGRTGGERRFTDLRHVGQLLHRAAQEEQLGVTALTGWLRRRVADAGSDTGDEERSRRLESDAAAVQVLTVHRSKGLEFPIVYVPFLWEASYIPKGEPVTFHETEGANERRVDVALSGPAWRRHCDQHVAEQRGEDLRLAYVAVTRARHQVVLWWAGSWDSRHSALGRLVFARAADGTVPPLGAATPGDATARETFATMAAQAPGRVSVETAAPGSALPWSPPAPAPGELHAARFGRTLDRRWRRTSYSDMTARAHEAPVGSEPEEAQLADEPDGPELAAAGEVATDLEAAALAASPAALLELPAGVAAGTLVHQVLEATDFAAPDLDAELTRALRTVPGRRAVALGDLSPIVAGLRGALHTPLGPLLGDGSLRDVSRADRLDELGFELPLAGGDAPVDQLTPELIARVLREELAEGDPLRAYARHLDDRALRQGVRGFLTGSLDLVVRIASAEGPRFAVLDYKTNWLGEPEEPLTAWHYRPQALISEMHRRHYGLQALLYLVAAHRFLRWRVAGYDPARHLGGVLYLFLRGMSGPETPVLHGARCGVFSWPAAPGLVTRLSDALDAGGAA